MQATYLVKDALTLKDWTERRPGGVKGGGADGGFRQPLFDTVHLRPEEGGTLNG